MRDAAEGNSGQGDSLLSLEAGEETLASSDDDAEGPTARKRTKRNEEEKLEQEETREDS